MKEGILITNNVTGKSTDRNILQVPFLECLLFALGDTLQVGRCAGVQVDRWADAAGAQVCRWAGAQVCAGGCPECSRGRTEKLFSRRAPSHLPELQTTKDETFLKHKYLSVNSHFLKELSKCHFKKFMKNSKRF